MSEDRDHRVKERAYEIWEREGRPSGQHDQHWEQARRELEDEDRGRTPGAAEATIQSAPKRGATRRAPGASAGKAAGEAGAPKPRSRSKSAT